MIVNFRRLLFVAFFKHEKQIFRNYKKQHKCQQFLVTKRYLRKG